MTRYKKSYRVAGERISDGPDSGLAADHPSEGLISCNPTRRQAKQRFPDLNLEIRATHVEGQGLAWNG
jgi:hypothetical protein